MNQGFQKIRRKPKIDVVPLIDVLMVLIIFFLVTMQFQELRALNVKLPKIESAGSNLVRMNLLFQLKKKVKPL
jgi:biopolymer transport protein ExbD